MHHHHHHHHHHQQQHDALTCVCFPNCICPNVPLSSCVYTLIHRDKPPDLLFLISVMFLIPELSLCIVVYLPFEINLLPRINSTFPCQSVKPLFCTKRIYLSPLTPPGSRSLPPAGSPRHLISINAFAFSRLNKIETLDGGENALARSLHMRKYALAIIAHNVSANK